MIGFKKTTTVALLAACLALGNNAASAAMYFSDSLTETTLNPNLTMEILNWPVPANTGYTAEFTQTGVVLSRLPNYLSNGLVQVFSNFTFSGNYQLTVDVSGLRTGLGDRAEAGLGITNGITGSDVFGYNNHSYSNANNWLGASTLSDIQIGLEDRLTIAGNSNGSQLKLNIFLMQEYSGIAANSVTFTNLTLTADSISQVPVPPAMVLFASGLLVLGALRKKSKV